MDPLALATWLQQIITEYAVTPLLIVFIGIFIAKILEQTLLFVFHEFKREGHAYTYSAYVVKWTVYVATILAAIASVGLLRIALWFFAGAVSALVAVRLLLWLFDFFPNSLAYPFIKQRYKEGSKIKTKLVEGTVVKVQLLDTHVRTVDGDELFIANATMRALKK